MSLQIQNLRPNLLALSAVGPLPLIAFGLALFSSAFLIFWVEPYFARMLLPGFGGAQVVWNTCLVFFQLSLLLGYTYAHLLCRYLTPRRQAIAHLAVLGFGVLFLPVLVSPEWAPPTGASPVIALFVVLTATLGAPFFALSANAPLLQHWFSLSGHRQAENPYVLYAASNAGSLCALLAYPFVIEPLLSLKQQAGLWAACYWGLVLLIAITGVYAARSAGTARRELPAASAETSWSERISWVVFAALPSSLLVGVTSYVSTDIASFPLLWLAPLALYLSTFVFAFAARPLFPHNNMLRMLPLAILFAAVALSPLRTGLGLTIGLHFLSFFLIAMACHGELARLKPAASKLTEFYFWLSLGGVIGGALTALVSPLLFDTIVEYPLALACVCLLRPGGDSRHIFSGGKQTALVFALVVFTIVQPLLIVSTTVSMLAGQAAILTIVAIAVRPGRLNVLLVMLAVLLAARSGPTAALRTGDPIWQGRSAYGAYTVTENREQGLRFLFHGTTLHGVETLAETDRPPPMTYYSAQGPLGDVMTALAKTSRDVGVIGLGAGNMACYALPHQVWTFYEIDALVHRIAADSGMFRALRTCAPDAKTIIGDGRLNAAKAGHAIYDLLIVDAFASDAIPIHLMTREAFVVYREALRSEGILVLHVSNRHFDLAPIVARIAAEVGLVAYHRHFVQPDKEKITRVTSSDWMVLARDEAHLRALISHPEWKRREPASSTPLWTDDFANVLSALK